MRSIILSFFFLTALFSCAQKPATGFKFPAASKTPVANEAVATFGEGCFWHSELVFQSLKGVRDAVSGYSGGTIKSPSYEKVCTGATGHAEAVQVYYDPSVISYKTLVDAFFASQDPTTPNRSGNDEGPQYRSIAFYRNDTEKQVLEAKIKELTAAKKYKDKIVTEIKPYSAFYKAEDYHQEYIATHQDNPYVQNVSIPEYLAFRKEFKGAAFKN